jgi:hypothetical protein
MKTLYYCILSITIILGLISSSFMLNVNADQDVILSPRKQMANGVDAKDVKCKLGLILMIRSTNGYAACLTINSSAKLTATGWGSIIESNMEAVLPVEQIKNTESAEDEREGKIITVNIKDGIGSNDR